MCVKKESSSKKEITSKKEIRIKKEITMIDDIPIITLCDHNAKNMPLVILNHGTSGKAEDMLDIANKLAEFGMFCVSVDALWHGRRSDESLNVMLNTGKYKAYYLKMLLHMAKDMSKIIDFYENDCNVDIKRTAITGISQGGYVTFMTLTKDHRITVAAPMIGSPDLTDKYGNSAEWDDVDKETKKEVLEEMPLNHFEKMLHSKLLVQNATSDTVVPITGVRRLNEKISKLRQNDNNYNYIEFPDIGHTCPETMQNNAIEWIKNKI